MQTIKKFNAQILSAVMTAFVLLFIFKIFSLYPLGEKTLSWGDLSQQNLPVLLEFKDVLAGKSGAFFSMTNAGGMDYLSVFLFLASSPFSLLTAFVDKADMIDFINIIIALKLITCSVTASFFFRYFFKRLDTLQTVSLSVAYAFCGYSMMFYQLITWLDVMYIFPLFVIAFEKLLSKEKIVPYVLTLSLLILFQFYLGYMLALFIIFSLALYLIFISRKKDRGKQIILFSVSTLLAALITSPVWLASFEQFLASARGVSVIDSLSSSLPFTASPTTFPIVLSTCFIAFGLIAFIKLRLFETKSCRPLYIMLLLFLIPLIIEPVNKMWHTGSYQAFPARYGHMLVLCGLAVFACVLSEHNRQGSQAHKNDLSALITAGAGVSGFIILSWYLLKNKRDILKSYVSSLWGSPESLTLITLTAFCGICVIAIILSLYKKQLLSMKTVSVLIAVFTLTECAFNSSVYMGYAGRDTANYKYAMELSGKINDDSVFRVKNFSKDFDANLTGAMGYNSLAHYTSFNTESYMFAMKKLGYSSYWMEVNSNGSTTLVDALMGNKYTIKRTTLTGEASTVYENKYYSIIENEHSLSLGTVISKEQAQALSQIPQGDRIEYQATLFSALTGENGLVTRYEPSSLINADLNTHSGNTYYYTDEEQDGKIIYTFHVDKKQKLYFDCFKYISTRLTEPVNGSFDIYVNGNIREISYPSKSTNGFLYLGEYENTDVNVTLSVKKSGSAYSFGVFGMDSQLLEKGLEGITQAEIEIKGDKIFADAVSESENGMLMLTIPSNRGFEITVNGKKTEAQPVLDAFMAIELEKGTNHIEITYTPYGFKLSMILFVLGISLLILFSVFISRRRFKYIPILEKLATGLYITFAGLIFILIYIFPIVVFTISTLKK